MKSDAMLPSSLSRIEEMRKTIGLIVGPLAFILILSIPTPESFLQLAREAMQPASPNAEILTLAHGTQVVLALLVLMVIWWITEAIPIPMTAFLPAIVLPVFHVQGTTAHALYVFDTKNVFLNFAHPIIFLFVGGFLLAAAMQKWGLDKRFTLMVLTKFRLANDSRSVLLGMMIVTAFISMWISNTATTVMMLPLAIRILAHMGCTPGNSRFGTALMLGIAWAASIGGVGTIIGTAPNGICISILRGSNLAAIGFLDWMKFGVPYVIILIPCAWIILLKIFPPEVKGMTGGREAMQAEFRALGKWSRGEKITFAFFHLAVLLWISKPFWRNIFPQQLATQLDWIDETVIALGVVLLLFLIPVNWKEKKFVLDWSDAGIIDWGTLLLFGGGIALSDAMFRTGLAYWIATSFVSIAGTPSTFVLLVIIVLLIDFLTEVTSNTAVTSMMVPIIISIASGVGANPIVLSIGAAVASSMAFMLPVATPPNALVYATGFIRISDMAKAGFILDILGWIMTIAIIYGIAHLLFGMFVM